MPSVAEQLKLLQENSECGDEVLMRELFKTTTGTGALSRPTLEIMPLPSERPGPFNSEIFRIRPDLTTTRAKGPFDLYSVFEYCHRYETKKEVSIRPVGKAEMDSYVLPKRNFANRPGDLAKKRLQVKLLRSVNALFKDRAKPPVSAAASTKAPDTKRNRRLNEAITTSKSLELEEELGDFLKTYLTNSRASTLMVPFPSL